MAVIPYDQKELKKKGHNEINRETNAKRVNDNMI